MQRETTPGKLYSCFSFVLSTTVSKGTPNTFVILPPPIMMALVAGVLPESSVRLATTTLVSFRLLQGETFFL